MPVINQDLRIAGTEYTFNDLCPKVLYSSSSGTTDDINIGDNVSNYDYFDITWQAISPNDQNFHLDQVLTTRVPLGNDMIISGVVGHPGWNQMGFVLQGLVGEGTYIKKNSIQPCCVISYGYYDTNHNWYNKMYTPSTRIFKIVGYQSRNNYNEIDRIYHA